MATYTLSEARANLSALLDDVANGEDVEITRHGKPAAHLVAPRGTATARTARMWSDVERLKADLHPGATQPLGPAVDYDADAHVRQIRAERDAG